MHSSGYDGKSIKLSVIAAKLALETIPKIIITKPRTSPTSVAKSTVNTFHFYIFSLSTLIILLLYSKTFFLISSQLSFTTYFVPVVKVITVSGVSSTVWIRSQFRTNRVLLIRVTSITLFHLPSLIPPFFLLVEYNSPVTQTIYIKTLLWHDCNKIVKFSTFFVNFCN